MDIFGTKRAKAQAAEIKALNAEIARTGVMLTDAQSELGAERMQHSYTRQERDAARIERETAQRERDEYRPDALKYRNSQAANQRRRIEALNRAAAAAAKAPTGRPTNGASGASA